MLMNWEAATWRDRLSILMITSMSWATYDHHTHSRKATSTIQNITIASRVLDLHIHHQIIQTVNLTLGYHMDLPVTAPWTASCNHWSNLVIYCNSLTLTIPTPKLNNNYSPLHITVWLPRDGHQKLSACSQPGSEITIDNSLGQWVVRDKLLQVTLRQHPQALGQIRPTVLLLHPPRLITSQPSIHPSIQTNLASLTIQSPLRLTHTLCQRLHPYMNLSVILNLILCQKNMLRESTVRTVLFSLITRIRRRLLVHFLILKGIYLEFKLPWSIQIHSRLRRQALVILQNIGRGSSRSSNNADFAFCSTCAFFEFLLLSYCISLLLYIYL